MRCPDASPGSISHLILGVSQLTINPPPMEYQTLGQLLERSRNDLVPSASRQDIGRVQP